MCSSIWLRYATRSRPLSFAVLIRLKFAASERDTAQRPIGGSVVDLQCAIVAVSRDCRPARQIGNDRLAKSGLLRDLGQSLFDPRMQGI